MTSPETSVVRRFETAFNAQDVEALVALFTERGTYTDTFFGAHNGHTALRQMYARMFHEGREYVWTMEVIVEDAQHAAAEWSFRYVVSDALPRSAGRRIQFRGMSLFVLQAGKIADYREYFDEGLALLQLGFAPDALTKVLRKRL